MGKLQWCLTAEIEEDAAKGQAPTTLPPCPFCNHAAISEDQGDNGWYIACDGDDCDIHPSIWGISRAEAEGIWSKRFLPNVNIKLVTEDRLGSTYTEPVEVKREDDNSFTLIVEAW